MLLLEKTTKAVNSFHTMKFNLLKILQFVLLALVIGVAASKFYFSKQLLPHHDVTQEADVLVEKIENVSKLVLVESTFSEVFSYKDAYKMFYDYLSFEKKAILKVTAKAAISIDLRKLVYTIDETNKQLIIEEIPEPELMIEPDIQYYDLQESTFNEFTIEELNKMNKDAVEQIRKLVRESNLYEMAKERVIEEFRDLELLSDYLGWTIVDNSRITQLKHFDDLRVIENF